MLASLLPGMLADERDASLRNNCRMMILDGSFLGGKSHIYMESQYENDQVWY